MLLVCLTLLTPIVLNVERWNDLKDYLIRDDKAYSGFDKFVRTLKDFDENVHSDMGFIEVYYNYRYAIAMVATKRGLRFVLKLADYRIKYNRFMIASSKSYDELMEFHAKVVKEKFNSDIIRNDKDRIMRMFK